MAKKKKKKKRQSGDINSKKKNKLQHAKLGEHPQKVFGDRKMSALIFEYAEPLVKKCKTFDHRYKIITIAMTAWNLACLPLDKQEEEKKEVIREISRGGDLEVQSFMEETINYLLERKRNFFSYEKRIVVDYTITELDNTVNLTVISFSPK